jgi:hypothetical protein
MGGWEGDGRMGGPGWEGLDNQRSTYHQQRRRRPPWPPGCSLPLLDTCPPRQHPDFCARWCPRQLGARHACLATSTLPTIAAKSQAFTQHVVPLGSAKATRLKAWRNWHTALTWATANQALIQVLPCPRTSSTPCCGTLPPWVPPTVVNTNDILISEKNDFNAKNN